MHDRKRQIYWNKANERKRRLENIPNRYIKLYFNFSIADFVKVFCKSGAYHDLLQQYFYNLTLNK